MFGLSACDPSDLARAFYLNRDPATPVACRAWVGSTRKAGWSEDQIPTVHLLMSRESRCDPLAVNHRSGDWGLMQIHHTWIGALCANGIACSLRDLLQPDVNLAAARYVFRVQGWRAWSTWHG